MTQIDLLKSKNSNNHKSRIIFIYDHVIIDKYCSLEPEQGEPLLSGQVRNKSLKQDRGVHFCKKG